MEHTSLLFYLAKPQSGGHFGLWPISLYVRTLIPDVLSKLAKGTERTHSTLRGHAFVVVPMFRALIMIV